MTFKILARRFVQLGADDLEKHTGEDAERCVVLDVQKDIFLQSINSLLSCHGDI